MKSMQKFSITDVLNQSWGGSTFPSYEGRLDASTPAAGGGGGAPSTPAASPAATPAVSTPAATPAVATPSTTPASSPGATPAATTPGATPASPTVPSPNGNDDNIAVLRQSHETLRSLGATPEQLRVATETFNRLFSEAQTLATELGYTPQSLQEAFREDAAGTLQILRQEAQTHRASPQYQEEQRIRDLVRRETQTITQEFARQQADRHNATIDSEFTRLFNANEAFKPRNGAECPPEIRGIVRDRFIETLKWNNAALKDVVGGKLSGLQKIFDEVVTDTMKAWNSYNTWGVSAGPGVTGPAAGVRPGAVPPASAQPPAGQMRDGRSGQFVKVPTLDQIAEGDIEADVLPSMRGFR